MPDISNYSDVDLMKIANTKSDATSMSDEDLMKIAGHNQIKPQSAFEKAAEDPLNPFYYYKRAGQFAMGLPEGLGNLAVGATQLVTDIVNPSGDSKFSQDLANKVKERNAAQSQLSTPERVGIIAGQTAPFLATGAGAGEAVASKMVESKLASLAPLVGGLTGAAVGGAEMGATLPLEQSGANNRGASALQNAAYSAATFGALKGGGKALGKAIDYFSPAQQRALEQLRQGLKNKGMSAESALKEMDDNGLSIVDFADPRFQLRNQAINSLQDQYTIKGIADESLKALDQTTNNTRNLITDMVSKNQLEPEEAGQLLGQSANKIIQAKLTARREAVRDLYNKAFEGDPMVPPDLPIFNIPVVQEAINVARADTRRFGPDAIAGDISNLPDNSVKVLHLAQQYLYKKSKDFTDLNTAEFSKVRGQVLDILKMDPNYAQAISKYAGDSVELEKLLNGTSIGKIAKQYNDKKIDDLTNSAMDVLRLPAKRIMQIRKENPEGMNDILRSSIENRLSTDVVEQKGGFSKAIFGRDNGLSLRAALGDDRITFKGLRKLARILDIKAERVRITQGAMEREAAKQNVPLTKWRTMMMAANKGIDLLTNRPAVQREFAKLTFTPEGRDALIKIMNTEDQKAQEKIVDDMLLKAISLSSVNTAEQQ